MVVEKTLVDFLSLAVFDDSFYRWAVSWAVFESLMAVVDDTRVWHCLMTALSQEPFAVVFVSKSIPGKQVAVNFHQLYPLKPATVQLQKNGTLCFAGKIHLGEL